MFSNDLIENIIITRESLGVTRQQFSTVLLMGDTDSEQSLIKEYSSLKEVLVDYLTTTPEYKACLALFQQQPSVSTVLIAQKTPQETWVQLYTRYINSGKYAYCVMLATADLTDEEIKALVALIQTNEQIIALNITDEKVLALAEYFKTLQYNRVVSIFKDNNTDYPNCAIMGAILPKDPGTQNLSLLPVVGIVPASLTTAKKREYELSNVNYYDYFSNGIARVGANCGEVASGESFRYIYMIDWMATTIKENISNLFLSKPVVPFNLFGLSLISSAIQQALATAVSRELIEPISEKNVVMPDLSTISSQDKISGILKGIKFYFTPTGSIKHIEGIYGIATDGQNIL
jgi:hypothetical protein